MTCVEGFCSDLGKRGICSYINLSVALWHFGHRGRFPRVARSTHRSTSSALVPLTSWPLWRSRSLSSYYKTYDKAYGEAGESHTTPLVALNTTPLFALKCNTRMYSHVYNV